MIKYFKANEKDIPFLKELWYQIFEENQNAIEIFFEKIFTTDICYVAKDNDKVVAMLYLLPTSVDGKKGCYLYGVATIPEYRKIGIAKNLIDFALTDSDAEFCVTLPASESLYNYYEKVGFKVLKTNCAEISRDELTALTKPYVLQDLVVTGYSGIRNRVLKNNFIFWNNQHIDFAFDYYKIYGAKIIKNNFGYAIAYEEDGVCKVIEIICDDKNAPYIFTDLLAEFNCEKFNFHLSPNQKFLKSEQKIFGMIKSLNGEEIFDVHCGLTLD